MPCSHRSLSNTRATKGESGRPLLAALRLIRQEAGDGVARESTETLCEQMNLVAEGLDSPDIEARGRTTPDDAVSRSARCKVVSGSFGDGVVGGVASGDGGVGGPAFWRRRCGWCGFWRRCCRWSDLETALWVVWFLETALSMVGSGDGVVGGRIWRGRKR